jgi:four helix bundle suffix protein
MGRLGGWRAGALGVWAVLCPGGTYGTHGTDGVLAVTTGFIAPHGGYKTLLSCEKAEIVYDATVYFCNRYVDRRSRTRDQMVQAARSGKQNIIAGSMASGTSKETEIKLTNVARASLEELLADYRDLLRARGARVGEKNSKEAVYLRTLGRDRHRSDRSHGSYGTHATYQTYRPFIEARPAEVRATIIICLIHQADYLLERQIREFERAFLEGGGLRERMTQARLEARKRLRS